MLSKYNLKELYFLTFILNGVKLNMGSGFDELFK